MDGTFRVKVTFFLVKGRSVLLLAAAAANNSSERWQYQQQALLTCLLTIETVLDRYSLSSWRNSNATDDPRGSAPTGVHRLRKEHSDSSLPSYI